MPSLFRSLLVASVLGDAVANPRVSFQFDQSNPFNERQTRHIFQHVMENMKVPEGDKQTVSFVDNGEFRKLFLEAKAKSSTPEAFGTPSVRQAFQFGGKIVVNQDKAPKKRSEFIRLLQHELGHGLGLPHRNDDSFMNPGRTGKITEEDRQRIINKRGF